MRKENWPLWPLVVLVLILGIYASIPSLVQLPVLMKLGLSPRVDIMPGDVTLEQGHYEEQDFDVTLYGRGGYVDRGLSCSWYIDGIKLHNFSEESMKLNGMVITILATKLEPGEHKLSAVIDLPFGLEATQDVQLTIVR